MNPVTCVPFWNELLDFALPEVQPSDHESVRAVLDDFEIDRGPALSQVLTAVARRKADTAKDPLYCGRDT